jgi:uncharacterized protein (DUF169 family)
MMDIAAYRACGEELERRLRLKTFPLSLKLLEKAEDIPEGAVRPLRDRGHHLSLCQAFQISRREGKTVAMCKEDNWCFEPVVGYGLAEPPQFFLDGHNRYPRDVATQEAGKHYAQEFPRLPVGRYLGILSAPLRATDYQPDLVMIYCDSAQLCLLMLGREYKEGYSLKCALSSHAACVYGVVPAAQTGECYVAVPCRGDRYRAMAGDEEMIFTVPKAKLEDLLEGLRYVEGTGSRLPQGYSFQAEYPLPESYLKIARMIGYLPGRD